MLKLWSRLAIGAVAVGGVLSATPAPAVAAPTVDFTDLCDEVGVNVDGVVAGDPLEVTRDGHVVVSTEVVGNQIGLTIPLGVSDGDELVALVNGSPVKQHIYQAPDGCPSLPLSMFTEDSCDGLVLLHVNNTGSEPISGFRLVDAFLQEEETPLEFPPGEATLPLPVPAERYTVRQRLDLTEAFWIDRTYREPEGCGDAPAGAVEATFTDECDQVVVEVASAIEPPLFYQVETETLDDREEIVETGVVRSGAPGVHRLPVRDGDLVEVGVPGSEPGTIDAIDVHPYVRPDSCDGGDDAGDGRGSGLPVTGVPVGLVVAGGLALFTAGAGLLLVARRRRVRFTSR